MTVSIFTPTHDPKFLPQLYASLRAQSDPGWDWTVVFNNGAEPMAFEDPRVKAHIVYKAPEWVGPLKALACEQAEGDILLELDHDDLLMPTAVADVKAAFSDQNVGFVYSNTIHALGDFQKVERFSESFGWKYREVTYDHHVLDEHVSFEPTPDSISRIWFAPNHLRAFRRDLYREVGGYNKDMRILDDLDLMCRLYLKTKFKHIDKGLYLYRVHGENTWLRYNEEIQQNVYRIYDQYIEALVERWVEEEDLRKLELGGRFAAKAGFETVDIRGDVDVRCDLNKRWPFEDSSVGVIRAFDIFEHLRSPVHTMKEIYRVLAPGGWVFCQVPSTDGRGAFQDPTHVSFWNENSFLYYTHREWARYIDCPVRFQAPRLFTTLKDDRGICWTVAHLISLKDNYRPCGLIEI